MDYKMSKYKGTALEFDITPNNRIVYLKAARVIPIDYEIISMIKQGEGRRHALTHHERCQQHHLLRIERL